MKCSRGITDITSIKNHVFKYPIAINFKLSIYISFYLKAVKNDNIISKENKIYTMFSKIYKPLGSLSIKAILYGNKNVKINRTITFINNQILLKP